MKKQYFLSLMFGFAIILMAFADTSNQSALYGDSFLMRAKGAEALYWNPALLSPAYHDILIPGINQSISISNNAFDIDTYDMINGSYLNDNDKHRIMQLIKNKLDFCAESHTTIFGIAFSNMAFASSVHLATRAQLSEKYIRLLLYGNEQDDYSFSRKYNQASGIAYQDFTLGIGNINLNNVIKTDVLPDIYFGATGSLLAGYGVFDTKKYNGSFHTGLDGISLHQEVKLGTGAGGLGFKSSFGLASEPLPYLTVGMSLDNVLGNIRWFAQTEDRTYTVDADSVYMVDLDQDLFTQDDSVHSISAFSTSLPPEFHLGAMYDFGYASVSADWIQGFKNSDITSAIGRVSIAGEFLPTPVLPLSLGISFGNADYPWRVSYGIGVRTKHITAGIGFQTFKAVDLLGVNSKGIAFSSYLTVPY